MSTPYPGIQPKNGQIRNEYFDILEFSRKLDVRKVNNAMYIGEHSKNLFEIMKRR